MWAGHRVRGSCTRTKVFKWVYLSAIWQKNDGDGSSVCPSYVPRRVCCHHVTSAVTKSIRSLLHSALLLICVLMWVNNVCSLHESSWGPLDRMEWEFGHFRLMNFLRMCPWRLRVKWSEVKWSEDIWMQPEGRADCWCPKVNRQRDLRKQIVDHNSRIQNEGTWSDFIIWPRSHVAPVWSWCHQPCQSSQYLFIVHIHAAEGERGLCASSRLSDGFSRPKRLRRPKTVSAVLSEVVQTYVMFRRAAGRWRRGTVRSASGCLFRLINSVSLRAVVNTC